MEDTTQHNAAQQAIDESAYQQRVKTRREVDLEAVLVMANELLESKKAE